VTDGQGSPPPPGGGPPPAGSANDTPGGPPGDPPAAFPDLALRWLHPPLRTRPGVKLTLRLEASNTGSAAAPAASIAIGLPAKWKGRSALRAPALAPGSTWVLKLRVQVAKKGRAKAHIVARLLGIQPGDHSNDRALLVYRLSHGRLRLAAHAAGAAPREAARFFCPLLAGA
jgi:hypothetical protein